MHVIPNASGLIGKMRMCDSAAEVVPQLKREWGENCRKQFITFFLISLDKSKSKDLAIKKKHTDIFIYIDRYI